MTSSRRHEARSRQDRVADLVLRLRDDLAPGPAEEAERPRRDALRDAVQAQLARRRGGRGGGGPPGAEPG
jgi:hypothetical protein